MIRWLLKRWELWKHRNDCPECGGAKYIERKYSRQTDGFDVEIYWATERCWYCNGEGKLPTK